ncbi:MAG TPA: polysaccharide deacetylase family protein, partial [Allocoleopsis sp.]
KKSWIHTTIIVIVTAILTIVININWPWHSQENLVFADSQAQSNTALQEMIVKLQEQARKDRLNFIIPKQFQAKVIEEVTVKSKEKIVALTFDDGPYLQWTEQILAILKKEKIKATFFWIGKNLKEYPQIGKKVVAQGHAIGNHTWHHWYHRMSPQLAAKEIDDTSKLITQVTGVKTTLFRPPGGFLHNGVADYAKKKNYLIAMWKADSVDYSRPGVDKMVNKVMKEIQNGGMILMHDGGGDRSQTVKAVPIIINKLKKQGYKFVTVPELLAMADTKQTVAKVVQKPPKKQVKPTTKQEN